MPDILAVGCAACLLAAHAVIYTYNRVCKKGICTPYNFWRLKNLETGNEAMGVFHFYIGYHCDMCLFYCPEYEVRQ
jgi:hypothetical protein